MIRLAFAALLYVLFANSAAQAADAKILSHPPLRVAPGPSDRAEATGPAYHVDPVNGDDEHDGSDAARWRSLEHAVKHLKPGDTLYLHGGVYYEPLEVSLIGTAEKPITIRSYPGEQAVIDAALREFFEDPAHAWAPCPDGAEGEYRSVRTYPNIRQVLGWFGDSMVGLNTYYYAKDLRSSDELIAHPEGADTKNTDINPLYCGPGLWYDHTTGRIHVRLAHTHLPQIDNYQGVTNPRDLPLVVTTHSALPVHLNGAEHVHLQDLVIRGGGYDTVVCDHAHHCVFDNVTIWCGTYGVRTLRTVPLKFHNCGLYGSCPPWLFRGDTSKRAYPGRPFRDITRLNTHSNWVTDAGREFSVYAHPMNDEFDISFCEFTDAHDGPYFGGVSLDFHHNLVENMQDDGIYLSQMYPRHLYMGAGATLKIHENVFRQCLTAFAFGGTEQTGDQVFIYRNLIDMRKPVQTGRPRSTAPDTIGTTTGKLLGDHGGPPWSTMNIYQNTLLSNYTRSGMGAFSAVAPERPRRIFNNVFYYTEGLGGYPGADPERGVVADANLFWSPTATPAAADSYFARYRKSPQHLASKEVYPAGSSTNSLVADPQFMQVDMSETAENDYRPRPGSPVVNAGVILPQEWPNALTDQDSGKPDIGLLPLGAKMFPVGRTAK